MDISATHNAETKEVTIQSYKIVCYCESLKDWLTTTLGAQ